jgi:hypothetical protein
LFAAADSGSVRDFVSRTLRIGAGGPHAGLLATVACFIDCGGRYQACADALGIHVSTLRYRIGRFQTQTGVDLTDPESRFSVGLALRLRALHGEGTADTSHPSRKPVPSPKPASSPGRKRRPGPSNGAARRTGAKPTHP